MARGWESKAVEAQIEESEAVRAPRWPPPPVPLTPEQVALKKAREQLESLIARVQKDLDAATHPRYREQLEGAVRDLQARLAALGEV